MNSTDDISMTAVLEKLHSVRNRVNAESFHRAYRDVCLGAVAAFGILFTDYLATFVPEFSYIGPRFPADYSADFSQPNSSECFRKSFTFMKITFLDSRYTGLLGQR